ncbi:hypothetical protein GEMRC1_002730 [Eukaryota sp. GEM-RC1]
MTIVQGSVSDSVGLTGPPTSCYTKTVSPDYFEFVSQFSINKQREYLTDSVIVFHEQHYPCHSAFLSSYSSILKDHFLSSGSEVFFSQLEFVVPDADLFFQILDYLYGQPLTLTLQNMGIVLTICSSLQLSSLANTIHTVVSQGFSKPRTLQLKSQEVLQTIRSSVQRDVVLTYKDTSLTINSLSLICSSEYFKNLFCLNFADSKNRKFSFDEEFPDVSPSNFETFFNYIQGEAFSLDVNNVVDFYQLAVYFQVENLKKICSSFVSPVLFSTHLCLLLKTISERYLLNFLIENIQIFTRLDDQQYQESPFPLPLTFVSVLVEVVSTAWIYECLSLSINDEVFEQDYHILNEVFEKIVLTGQNIGFVYRSLLPLFSHPYLHQFMLTWSLKVFENIKNVNVVPEEWFMWTYLNTVNQQQCRMLSSDLVVQNFSLLVDETSNPLDVSKCLYLNPEVFLHLKANLPSSYDLFLFNCLVKSWKETDLWTVKNFEAVIGDYDFQTTGNPVQILNALSELTIDTRLSPFLSTVLLNHALALLNHRGQSFCCSRSATAFLKVLMHLTLKNNVTGLNKMAFLSY